MKKIGNKHNERSGRFKKSQYEKQCFVSLFFVAAQKSRSVCIGRRSRIYLSEPRVKISRTNFMYIYPHKRNVDALQMVGVVIKVVVFRTLCRVVARNALTVLTAVAVAGQFVQHLDVSADGC